MDLTCMTALFCVEKPTVDSSVNEMPFTSDGWPYFCDNADCHAANDSEAWKTTARQSTSPRTDARPRSPAQPEARSPATSTLSRTSQDRPILVCLDFRTNSVSGKGGTTCSGDIPDDSDFQRTAGWRCARSPSMRFSTAAANCRRMLLFKSDVMLLRPSRRCRPSPRYARFLRTARHKCGLSRLLLRERRFKVRVHVACEAGCECRDGALVRLAFKLRRLRRQTLKAKKKGLLETAQTHARVTLIIALAVVQNSFVLQQLRGLQHRISVSVDAQGVGSRSLCGRVVEEITRPLGST